MNLLQGNGDISFPDFTSIMAKKLKEYEGEDSLRLAFRVFDRENNGKVLQLCFYIHVLPFEFYYVWLLSIVFNL